MKSLSLSEQHRVTELQKELTNLVKFIADLEDENRQDMKSFSDGDYNNRASFKKAKDVLEHIKQRRKEIKKSEKKCAEIRLELKKFD